MQKKILKRIILLSINFILVFNYIFLISLSADSMQKEWEKMPDHKKQETIDQMEMYKDSM